MPSKRPKKRRVVLGTGYPWAMGVGPEYFELRLHKNAVGVVPIPIRWPKKWWLKTVPRIRLVAEILED